MNLKKLALAAAAGSALLAAVPAFAHPQDWAPEHDHGWRAKHRHTEHYRAPKHVYYPVERVVVVPAAPVYYAPPPRPVISGQLPVGRNANLSFDFQL